MKSVVILFLISFTLYAQENTLKIRDYEIILGMNIDDVWDMLAPNFNIVEDDAGNFYVSDNKDNPVCVVNFKDEKVVKIIKDWGTTYKTNAGQVFKIFWNILKEHEKKLDSVKIDPQQVFSAQGDKSNIMIYFEENWYLEIDIRFNVTILEVLESPDLKK